MLHHRLRRTFCLVAFLAFCSITCLAQSAVVSGTVTDQRGSAVAGATVTVTNKATGAARTVNTTAEGFYQIPQLAPGTYSVRAEAAGFKAVVRNDVQALVNTP